MPGAALVFHHIHAFPKTCGEIGGEQRSIGDCVYDFAVLLQPRIFNTVPVGKFLFGIHLHLYAVNLAQYYTLRYKVTTSTKKNQTFTKVYPIYCTNCPRLPYNLHFIGHFRSISW